MEPVTIFWFRRDLRINDNTGLYYALKERGNVIPLLFLIPKYSKNSRIIPTDVFLLSL